MTSNAANGPSHVSRSRSHMPKASQIEVKEDQLQTFTRRLAELFARLGGNPSSEDALPKDAIELELAGDFPKWATMLKQLDETNKIFENEGEVFLV